MKFVNTALAVVALATFTGLGIQAADAQTYRAWKTSSAPTINGSLDDECWKSCERLTGFKETYHNLDANQSTEVMLCRDEKNLYVAWVCHDPQPELIHAQQKKRSSDLSADDYVSVLLDPDNRRVTNYVYSVNPVGTQNESIPSGSAGNITWRGDWSAASGQTQDGWCAEMAIPFDMLRYPAGCDSFGIAFMRYSPRLEQQSYLPYLGPNIDLTRFASLVELQLPRQVSRPVLMPYMVSSTQPGRSFSDFGLDFKQELPNSMTAMATYNPDFSDVQDAVASIDFSHTERFLPEHRPFFQEGANIFPDSTAFYSRRIEDFNWGVKTFGKVGRQSIALLDAAKSGESNHLAASYAYDLSPDAGLSVYFTGSMVRQAYKTDPNEPDASMCIAPGGFFRWKDGTNKTTLSFRRYGSINPGVDSNGSSFVASLTKETAPRHFGYTVQYTQTSPDYYVRDAYAPLTGIKGLFVSYGFHDRPTSGRYTFWNTYVDICRYAAATGGVHHQNITLYSNCTTRSEWGLGSVFAVGEWLNEPESTAQVNIGWLKRHLYSGGSLSYTVGKREGEDYTNTSLSQSFKITRKLMLSAGMQWTRLGELQDDSQMTLLANYDISPEKSLGAWVVTRGSNRNTCFTYKHTVRSGSDIYLIYGYPNTLSTEKRIAMKVVTPMAW